MASSSLDRKGFRFIFHEAQKFSSSLRITNQSSQKLQILCFLLLILTGCKHEDISSITLAQSPNLTPSSEASMTPLPLSPLPSPLPLPLPSPSLSPLPLPSLSPPPLTLPSPSPSIVLNSNEILVSWNANREKLVNSIHGGYKVYYSQTPGFDLQSAMFIDVPYVSGPLAPTNTKLQNLAAGTYYLKIVAYSGITLPNSDTLAVSDSSQELSFSVP